MANWFCSVFNCCMCRKRMSSPRCRSELIDPAWAVIVPGQKCIKNKKKRKKKYVSDNGNHEFLPCCQNSTWVRDPVLIVVSLLSDAPSSENSITK